MNTRNLILAAFVALPLSAGAMWLHAEDQPAAAPKAETKTDGDAKTEKQPDRRDKDGRDKDAKDSREDRRRGDWGPRPGYLNGPSSSNPFNQFSADELRSMIEAVQPRNPRLAEKMKDRFADAIAKKPVKLTQEQVDAALSIFEDREPHLAHRIKESAKDSPDRVATMLAFHWPRLEKAIELKKTDRELYDAQTAEILTQGESRGLLWKLRKAVQDKNEAEATKLQDDLRTKLLAQHQARQKIRHLELARMNDKIKKLSEEITAEEERSAQVIDKHFNDMLKWAQSRLERGSDRPGERGDRPDRPEKTDRPDKRDSTDKPDAPNPQ